jgi:hypothetical protein
MSGSREGFALAGYVLVSWAIPFLSGFAFFAPDENSGEFKLAVDKNVFKNVMVMIAAPLFAVLLSRTVRWRDGASVTRAGLAFLSGNLFLDLLILVPMSKMDVGDYFAEIGAGYVVFTVVNCWFGYALANSERPSQNSFIGILLRAPLASLISYVAISLLHDEKQETTTVPIWHFRTYMMMVASVSLGLNLFKAFEQVRDLQTYAVLATAVFLAEVVAIDLVSICPVFKWSYERYLWERGVRLVFSGVGLSLIARSVGVQAQKTK